MRKRSLALLTSILLSGFAAKAEETPPTNPSSTQAAPAAAEPEKPKSFLENTEFNATVDFYAEYNLADPTSNTNKIRAWDTVHGQGPQLTMGKFTINHPADWFGFRIDVGFGSGITLLAATDPSTKLDPTEVKWHGPFEQAYLSFKFGKAHPLTIDVGKFLSPVGFEMPETRDNWNYTRALLFNWAVPFFHTGVRLSMPVTDTLTLTGTLVNGWNTFVLNGSKFRTGSIQFAFNPNAKASLVLNYMTGYTDALHNTVRHMLDLVGIFSPTEKLKLGVNGDFGYDDGNKWYGAALYARYQFIPWFAAAVRGEVFNDADGYMLGAVDDMGKPMPQLVGEFTGTLEGAWDIGKLNLIVRLEYRHDQSDHAYFDGKVISGLLPPSGAPPSCPGDASCNKSQDTLLVGVTGYWKGF